MFDLSTVSKSVRKMKVLLTVKCLIVRWGSQMCLNVGGDSFHFVFYEVKFSKLLSFFQLACKSLINDYIVPNKCKKSSY